MHLLSGHLYIQKDIDKVEQVYGGVQQDLFLIITLIQPASVRY